MSRDAPTTYCLGLLLATVVLVYADKGPCYLFPGETFLEFRPNNLNISHSLHYSLQFETTENTGVLMYAEGPDDYEGMFLSGGRLVYLLTNPSPSGVEGTTGGLYISETRVNTGNWFKVELWRNWVVRQGRLGDTELKTGMAIYDSNKNLLETHTDNFNHRGVVLNPIIYIGGIRSTMIHTHGSSESQFKGRMKEMNEERNDFAFKSYALNSGQRVILCS